MIIDHPECPLQSLDSSVETVQLSCACLHDHERGREATHRQVKEISQPISIRVDTLQELLESERDEGLGRLNCIESENEEGLGSYIVTVVATGQQSGSITFLGPTFLSGEIPLCTE